MKTQFNIQDKASVMWAIYRKIRSFSRTQEEQCCAPVLFIVMTLGFPRLENTDGLNRTQSQLICSVSYRQLESNKT